MATRKVKHRTPTPYPRAIQSRSYMNVTQTWWKNGQGRRNTVKIINGKGEKRVELLGSQGQAMKTKTRRLTKSETNRILKGKFIPGLWRNCSLGFC